VFENVIVGVDGRPGGRDAIALAKQLAAPDTRIALAHVYGSDGMLGRGGGLALAAERESSTQMLQREREAGSLDADLVMAMGPAVGRALHDLAGGQHADLLVVGTCHRGLLGRVLAGNDALATLNGAPCAVAIAPSGYEHHVSELQTVGVGEDASSESAMALQAARELADRHGAEVRALSVVSLQSVPSDSSGPADCADTTERLLGEERSRLESIPGIAGDAVYGDPSDELARLSESVDLLVVGSRGHGPFGRLMNGSSSNYLARRVHCPLLVLPRPRSASGPTREATRSAQQPAKASR